MKPRVKSRLYVPCALPRFMTQSLRAAGLLKGLEESSIFKSILVAQIRSPRGHVLSQWKYRNDFEATLRWCAEGVFLLWKEKECVNLE
jgi:hypothetical protein